MEDVPKEGDYFVFEYYKAYSSESLIVPLIFKKGKLEEIIEFGSYDPEEKICSDSNKCLKFLREKNIQRIFTGKGNGDSAYSELYNFIIHFNAGERKYYFHYDCINDGELEEIKILNIKSQKLSEKEKEKRWKDLVEIIG